MINKEPALDKSYLSTLPAVDRVDVICDYFEEQLVAGENPRIEDLLNLAPSRDLLLRELLAVEVEVKRNAGDTVSITETAGRFPNDTAIVADVFASQHEPVDQIRLPLEIDHFRLEELVGRGSFGNVYRAVDTKLNRTVAIKLASDDAPKNVVKRMLREAQSAAQLSHPGIVSVHSIGTSEYGPYIVMEYIHGETLRDRIARVGRMDYPAVANMMIQIARAVHYAHENGVIHRDLKPANIMLTTSDDDATNSERAQVLDFGLARPQFVEKTLTYSGQILGTPNYMSPEQAIGNRDGVSANSDIYSLGVILFEMLTGQLPFDGDLPSLIRRIAEEPAPSPRKLQRGIPQDLAIICQKCLEKDTQHRYTSASELANDLDCWIEKRPIKARPKSTMRQFKSWVQRRKTIAASIVFCVMVGTVGALTQHTMSENEKARKLVNDLFVQPPGKLLSAMRQVQDSSRARREVAELVSVPGLTVNTRYLSALTLLPFDKELVPVVTKYIPQIGIPEFLATIDESEKHSAKISDAFWSDLGKNPVDDESLMKLAYVSRFDSDNPRLDTYHYQLAKSILDSQKDVGELTDLFEHMIDVLVAPITELLNAARNADERTRAAEFLVRSIDDKRSFLDYICESERETFQIFVDAIRSDSQLARTWIEVELARQVELKTEKEVKNRAKLIVALLDICKPGDVDFSKYVQTAPDPRYQSYLIHLPHQLKVSADKVVRQIPIQKLEDVTYALVLCLSKYSMKDLTVDERDKIVEWLVFNYEFHPDPGIHASTLYILNKWGYQEAIEKIDTRLIIEGISSERDWYLNSLGQCMAIFQISLPNPESVTNSDKIAVRLAVAMTHTTVEQYYSIMDKNFEVPEEEKDLPKGYLTFFDAIEFCHRLNEHEGLPNPIKYTKTNEENGILYESETDLTICGYRLPDILEWKQFCDSNVGEDIKMFFGNMETVDTNNYGRYDKDGKLFPVTDSMPSQFGLFGIFRNACEWSISEKQQPSVKGFRLNVKHRLPPGAKANFSNSGTRLGFGSRAIDSNLERRMDDSHGNVFLLMKLIYCGMRICRPLSINN